MSRVGGAGSRSRSRDVSWGGCVFSEVRWAASLAEGKESPPGPLARVPPAVLATVEGLGRRGAVSTAVPSPSPHTPPLHPARPPARPPVVPPVGPSLRLFSPSSPCLLRARPSLRPRGRVSPVRFPLSLARLGSGLPRRLAAPPRAPPAAVPSARPGLPRTLRTLLAQLPPRPLSQPGRHRRPLARPPARRLTWCLHLALQLCHWRRRDVWESPEPRLARPPARPPGPACPGAEVSHGRARGGGGRRAPRREGGRGRRAGDGGPRRAGERAGERAGGWPRGRTGCLAQLPLLLSAAPSSRRLLPGAPRFRGGKRRPGRGWELGSPEPWDGEGSARPPSRGAAV